MNTNQIDYVLELAETLNFSRAAENLFIAQPTLTYNVKVVEKEIGFTLFERSGKAVALTPAGQLFCQNLRQIRSQLNESIERGQNYSTSFSDHISLSLPSRSALPSLPMVMRDFRRKHPDVLVTPHIGNPDRLADFSAGNVDIAFVSRPDMPHLPRATYTPLFHAPIFLLTSSDDFLADLKIASTQDLNGKTLLVNGGSSTQLRRLQQEVLAAASAKSLNSPTHEFTLIVVASGQAVCLTPGYLHSPGDGVVWIPFETDLTYECGLITHTNEVRPIVEEFVALLQRAERDRFGWLAGTILR